MSSRVRFAAFSAAARAFSAPVAAFASLFLVFSPFFFGLGRLHAFGQFGAKAEEGADYVIILGAQWKTTGPSYALQKRLDKAIEYLNANPETKAIVSGGQSYNEPVSEAEGMKGYLADAGIDPERILAEDASTNTTQNLIYSGELLNKSEDSVVVVTNNFHMFRALAIAKKQGYLHVEGLSAGTFPLTVPNNLLREAFGIVKDFMANNL